MDPPYQIFGSSIIFLLTLTMKIQITSDAHNRDLFQIKFLDKKYGRIKKKRHVLLARRDYFTKLCLP